MKTKLLIKTAVYLSPTYHQTFWHLLRCISYTGGCFPSPIESRQPLHETMQGPNSNNRYLLVNRTFAQLLEFNILIARDLHAVARKF